jgi:GGDEF domain-containing protein
VALALLSGGFEGHVLGGLATAAVASLLQGALGAFWLLGVQGERWLRVEEDRPVFDVLSVMLGTRHYVPLRPDVVRDPSSGLYDRTFLEDRLALELERAEHLAATVALLLVETHEPPPDVGRAMLAGLRLTDLSCRWGPRRYLALLPGADRTTARSTALRVAEGLPGPGRMGIAAYPDDGVELGTLVEAAARRLRDVPR